MVGPLYQRDGNVLFESTVSVSASSGTVGFIRVIRQQRHGVNARVAARLVEGAVLLNGNRDGTMWSESGPIRYPLTPGDAARAFQTMADSVTSARQRLEAEVDATTGELSTVSGRLRVLHEELRESERFATLGRLSGNVGHELRNPLGVMSNIAFLLDTLPDASDKLKDCTRVLREQIRVSDRIISDVLDGARSGAPMRSAVNVAGLLDEIVTRAEIPDSIRVEREFAIPLPHLVLDRDHVAQILWNLVTNAVQAMHEAGTLTMVAAYSDGRLRIEVRDTGDGIPTTEVERIFEPMYTTKAHGIGLGLSISRAFARANGGDLLTKRIDRGACFVLDLPAAVATSESKEDLPEWTLTPS